MTTLYKVLNLDGTPCHGGNGKWLLPEGDGPGPWMPVIEDIVPCTRGYHLCRRQDLIQWLGPTIWLAEGRGDVVECDDKVVYPEARLIRWMTAWNEHTARLFAADCAERVLPIYEKQFPNDLRPRNAVEAARKFARGELTREELAAAGDAAWAAAGAAGDAAWDGAAAAGDAARAAARAAAGDAAGDAARAAAGDAAWDAAGAAGDAAWDGAAAAWDAAWAAARAAAGAAAGDAAWAAARAAAWAAWTARDAAWAWQTERLFQYLEGKP